MGSRLCLPDDDIGGLEISLRRNSQYGKYFLLLKTREKSNLGRLNHGGVQGGARGCGEPNILSRDPISHRLTRMLSLNTGLVILPQIILSQNLCCVVWQK